jgi:hypothetical protein
MTIDERLENLAHNIELLHGMMHDVITAQAKTQEKTDKQIAETAKGLNRMRRYAFMIALDHETRLSKLEQIRREESEESEE